MHIDIHTRVSDIDSDATPLVFVHGMWHAAWCWAETFQPYFADHGYTSHALSLRGHGASDRRDRLRMTPLSAFVSDVAHVVEQLDRKPILVGHSMGGMVVQKYLGTHEAAAAILLGSAPPAGLLPATWRMAKKHPLNILKVTLTFNLLHTIGTPGLYGELFFSEGFDDGALMRYYEIVRQQNESMRAFFDMMFLDLPRPRNVDTQMLVLGAAEDNLISPDEVRATARAYNTEARFIPNIGHAMMLDTRWQNVADRMLGWLKEHDL